VILFLDKEPSRAVLAFNRMNKADRENTIWCRTAEEAMCTLWDYRRVLEKAFLEHDLGDVSYMNTGSPECGMEIVRFLEKKARKEPTEFEHLRKVKVTVHTWNEHAGPIMVDRLRKIGLSAELKPFGM
jgi:hypothetical protein